MQPSFVIALVFNFSLAYCRRVLHGIKAYAVDRPDWSLVTISPSGDIAKQIAAIGAHGLIGHIYESELGSRLIAAQMPLVNVCGLVADLPIARIGIDDLQVGAVAARHFLDRGFRSFAFLGHASLAASTQRERGFRVAVAAAGHRLHAFHVPAERLFDPNANDPVLGDAVRPWLSSLPARTAIFAFSDVLALQLAQTCRQLGLRVPEDLALVGVDDDDLLCDLARPTLSSISIPGDTVGYHAAAELDRQLNGQARRQQPLLFPPHGVTVRASSDIAAVDDPLVAEAIRSIHTDIHATVALERVLRAAGVCRRTLERRFRAALGRGMHDEIRRVRLDTAKGLLANTDAAMPVVAERSGFSDAKRLSIVFRQQLGTTPTAYRCRFRARR